MYGLHRLVCIVGALFFCLSSFSVSAAVYKPVSVYTVSRDLQSFKIENRYHLEKLATEQTNPLGTMPKNKALTVTTGKDTLGKIARGAKKGTALNVAVVAAVAASGWAIDELTNQVVRKESVPIDLPDTDIYEEGFYFCHVQCASTPVEAVKLTNPSDSCYSVVAYTPSTGNGYVRRSDCNTGVRKSDHSFTRSSCSEGNCYPLPVVDSSVVIPDADFDDEILPKLINVPGHAWDAELKDSAGRPIITPELQDALHDWYEDLADRDPYLTYDPSTGRFTYTPPPINEVPSDPVDYDAMPSNPVNADEWDHATAGSSWPEFCVWAKYVCDWIDWTKEEPESLDPDDILVDQIDLSDLKETYDSGLGSGSCPASVSTSMQGKTIQYDFQPACDAAAIIKPILIAAAGLIAALIIAGASRGGAL